MVDLMSSLERGQQLSYGARNPLPQFGAAAGEARQKKSLTDILQTRQSQGPAAARDKAISEGFDQVAQLYQDEVASLDKAERDRYDQGLDVYGQVLQMAMDDPDLLASMPKIGKELGQRYPGLRVGEDAMPLTMEEVRDELAVYGMLKSYRDERTKIEAERAEADLDRRRVAVSERGASLAERRHNRDVFESDRDFEERQAQRAASAADAARSAGSVTLAAEARGRAAAGLPGAVRADEELAELFKQGARFRGTKDGSLAPSDLLRDARDQVATNLSGLPLGLGEEASKIVGTEQWEAINRASSAFESAMLPILSGAAVTESEARRTIRAALPQAGDSDRTLAAKAAHRTTMIGGLRAALEGLPFDVDEMNRRADEIERMMLEDSGALTNGGDSTNAAIPERAVNHLRANPQLAEKFDEKYGAGAAARILGQ